MTRGVDAGPWMTLRSDQTVLPHRIFRLFEALGNSNEHVVRYRRLLAQALN